MTNSAAQPRKDIQSGRRAIILPIIAAMGLALAMAATTRSSAVAAPDDVERRFIVEPPDWLVLLVVTVLTAARSTNIAHVSSK
jgi:hypothetical protein